MNQKQFKIGCLRFTIARKTNRKCADIYLTPNYLKHIERRQKTEDIEKRKLLWQKQHTFSKDRRRPSP